MVEEAVRGSTASSDPADCRRYNTQKALEQTTKLRGPSAFEACEVVALEAWPLPDEVTVSPIEIDGEEAAAEGISTTQGWKRSSSILPRSR